jgi:hypothetical protein
MFSNDILDLPQTMCCLVFIDMDVWYLEFICTFTIPFIVFIGTFAKIVAILAWCFYGCKCLGIYTND